MDLEETVVGVTDYTRGVVRGGIEGSVIGGVSGVELWRRSSCRSCWWLLQQWYRNVFNRISCELGW